MNKLICTFESWTGVRPRLVSLRFIARSVIGLIPGSILPLDEEAFDHSSMLTSQQKFFFKWPGPPRA